MIISEQNKNILPAFLQAQQSVETVRKESTNPHFRSKYANIESIFDSVKPALAEVGCVLIHSVVDRHTKLFVQTTVVHAQSGEYVASLFPFHPEKENPQKEGSALTYARRYGTMSLMGIAPAEDDDGNAASAPRKKKASPHSRKVASEQRRTNVHDVRSQPIATPDQRGQKTFTAPPLAPADRPHNGPLVGHLLTKIDDAKTVSDLWNLTSIMKRDVATLNEEDATRVRQHFHLKKSNLQSAAEAKVSKVGPGSLRSHIGQ